MRAGYHVLQCKKCKSFYPLPKRVVDIIKCKECTARENAEQMRYIHTLYDPIIQSIGNQR